MSGGRCCLIVILMIILLPQSLQSWSFAPPYRSVSRQCDLVKRTSLPISGMKTLKERHSCRQSPLNFSIASPFTYRNCLVLLLNHTIRHEQSHQADEDQTHGVRSTKVIQGFMKDRLFLSTISMFEQDNNHVYFQDFGVSKRYI